jgi:hypothetical protein
MLKIIKIKTFKLIFLKNEQFSTLYLHFFTQHFGYS